MGNLGLGEGLIEALELGVLMLGFRRWQRAQRQGRTRGSAALAGCQGESLGAGSGENLALVGQGSVRQRGTAVRGGLG